MNIFESITKLMQESISISKDKTNTQQNFKYRGIDDVMNTFYPLLSKYKVFVVPEVLEQQREERTTKNGGNIIYSIMKIKYTFYAEDGSNISAIVVGEGMDTSDKASNKAMAVAMKYAMFQTFCIPTDEMKDSDAESLPPSQPKSKTMTLETAENMKTKNGTLYKDLDDAKLEWIVNNVQKDELRKAAKLVLDARLDKAIEDDANLQEQNLKDIDAPF